MLLSERLTEHAEKIRALGKRAQQDILEIGRLLTEAKTLCRHGEWLFWLEKEFTWSEATACRYMRIYAFASELKSDTLPDLSLSLSTLDELSRRRTPPEVVSQILAKAERGTRVTASEVKAATALVVPFPKRGWPPAPVITAKLVPVREPPPEPHSALDWHLFNMLENAAIYINDIADWPDLDKKVVKAFIEDGPYRCVILRAAEAFARAGALGKRLLDAAPKTEEG